ncbi:MAG: hypothetical protein J0L94_00570 [Rhodothermia bacterium]|nr:hypothetical protein [Rhodothermia bacterium]
MCASIVPDLTFGVFRFEIRCTTHLHLRPFVASVFRGALGGAFRRWTCLTRIESRKDYLLRPLYFYSMQNLEPWLCENLSRGHHPHQSQYPLAVQKEIHRSVRSRMRERGLCRKNHLLRKFGSFWQTLFVGQFLHFGHAAIFGLGHST